MADRSITARAAYAASSPSLASRERCGLAPCGAAGLPSISPTNFVGAKRAAQWMVDTHAHTGAEGMRRS